jgi:predicted negative regulator of RcsB-dependent stress response
MNEQQPALKGDRLIEFLERFQHWISENYKFLIALFIIAFAAAMGSQYVQDQAVSQEQHFWELASKAETKEDREKFVAKYADSNAAKFVGLNLARTHLDDGEFDKADSVLSAFITNSAEHPQLGLAHLLRAYAREDLGKTSEAVQDYQSAAEDKHLSLLAQAGLARLK